MTPNCCTKQDNTVRQAASLERPLLLDDVVCLDLIIDAKVLEAIESDTAFASLAHLCDVLFDVFESVDFAYRSLAAKYLHQVGQRDKLTFVNDLATTENLDCGVALNAAIAHLATSDCARHTLLDIDIKGLRHVRLQRRKR